MDATPLLFVLAGVILVVVAVLLLQTQSPRLAILNGSVLDFIEDGAAMHRKFTSHSRGFSSLLFHENRPVVIENGVTEANVVATCERLYERGIRIFTGMLESQLAVAVQPFARHHPDAIVLSASSSVPRHGILPPNLFRLYPDDSGIALITEQVITQKFPTTQTGARRVVVVLGTPSSVWAQGVHAMMYAMDGERFQVTSEMTSSEAAGSARSDTVYIYAGSKDDFNLTTLFSGANILVMSGTGWVLPDPEPGDAQSTVFGLDMVNTMETQHAAMMRLENMSIWPGYLLHAMQVATEVDSLWDGRTDLTSFVYTRYGPGGLRVFDSRHDGLGAGAYVTVLKYACTNCFGFSFSDIIKTVEAAATDALVVVGGLVPAPLTCASQAAACAVPLGAATAAIAVGTHPAGSLLSGMQGACAPLVSETACISATTGFSQACVDRMAACVQGDVNQCVETAAHCTASALLTAVAAQAGTLLPFV